MQVPKYHIYIEYAEPEKSGIRFNITLEELMRTFVTPFTASQPFWFMGRLLNPVKVTKTILFWSYETADKLILPNQENLVIAKDKKFLIESILKGKVKGAYLCTEKFLTSNEKAPPSFLVSAANVSGTIKPRIFVVSGSDDEMKQTFTAALTKLYLAPVVMREQASQGKRLVEQFTDYADVGFAVVLLSPDDFVYAKDELPAKRKLRPRQDVIFFLGFLIGKLGKSKVLVFHKEINNFEALTDFEGIKFTAFDDRDSWKLSLLRELTANGYTVDASRILN